MRSEKKKNFCREVTNHDRHKSSILFDTLLSESNLTCWNGKCTKFLRISGMNLILFCSIEQASGPMAMASRSFPPGKLDTCHPARRTLGYRCSKYSELLHSLEYLLQVPNHCRTLDIAKVPNCLQTWNLLEGLSFAGVLSNCMNNRSVTF